MYRLDVEQGILMRDGERVPLVPKAVDLLRVLAERGGKIVTKEELLARVWPDVTVEEANIAKLVFVLRKELGEDAIETVPRRGYRLVVVVRLTEPPRAVVPAAYDLYLQGRYLWNRRPGDVVWRALECFQKAIELDEKFAPAWAGIADVYSTLGSWEAGVLPHAEAQTKAWHYASRALELDPSNIDAHTTLAYTTLHYGWDLVGADRLFTRALELAPTHAAAHHWHSHCLAAAGRGAESLAASQRALAREPMNLLLHVHLAWHHVIIGDAARGRDQAERVIAMDPSFHWGHYFSAWGAEATGDVSHAVDAMQRARECSGDDLVMLAGHGRALAVAGDRAAALDIVRQLEQRAMFDYEIALIHLGLGDRTHALAALDRARLARSGWMIYSRIDPRLAEVRGDSRLQLAPITSAR